jgi:acyl-CoA synthetase (AMP-forming)/AMP-acid ligase II
MPHATIWAILAEAERRFGARPALIEDGSGETRRWTYGELAGRVRARAHHWRELGILPGDRVAILDWNSNAFLESYFAAAALGAILCPLNHRLAVPELAEILNDAGARLVLAAPGFASVIAALRSRAGSVEHWTGCDAELPDHGASFTPAVVAHDDVAQLYYTSGTTGRPKGVMLTHRNVCVHADWAVRELALTGRDRWGHFAPMFHLADAWATFALTQVGGVHVMTPRFEADGAVAAWSRARVHRRRASRACASCSRAARRSRRRWSGTC